MTTSLQESNISGVGSKADAAQRQEAASMKKIGLGLGRLQVCKSGVLRTYVTQTVVPILVLILGKLMVTFIRVIRSSSYTPKKIQRQEN